MQDLVSALSIVECTRLYDFCEIKFENLVSYGILVDSTNLFIGVIPFISVNAKAEVCSNSGLIGSSSG